MGVAVAFSHFWDTPWPPQLLWDDGERPPNNIRAQQSAGLKLLQ